jgi:glycogen synthase
LRGRFDSSTAKMKILIYSHSFAPAVGGAETYAMLLAQGLASNSEAAHPDGIEVTLVTETPANDYCDLSLPFRTVRQPSFPSLVQLIHRASIVQMAGPCLLPMLVAWLLRTPFVIEQHGYQAICPNGLLFFEPTKSACPGHFMAGRHAKCWECNRGVGRLRSLKMWLVTFPRRWLCNRAAANIAITHHVEERLQLGNSLVIYYGVPNAMQSESLACKPERSSLPCFAYLGRLVSEKGLEVLIDAAGLLGQEGLDFRLKFIGDGPERKRLEGRARARSLDKHVIFTGFVTGEALRCAVDDVAVVVMPSRWEETAGFAAIEQMMRGRLVVCSDVGGLGEVVDGAGLKCAAENAPALAALLRQVMENPHIVEEFGKKAHERAERLFAVDRMIREHVELFCGVIGRKLAGRQAAPEFR